jgi:hypothetical protein
MNTLSNVWVPEFRHSETDDLYPLQKVPLPSQTFSQADVS